MPKSHKESWVSLKCRIELYLVWCSLNLTKICYTCWTFFSSSERKFQFINYCSEGCKKTWATIFISMSYVDSSSIFCENNKIKRDKSKVWVIRGQMKGVNHLDSIEMLDYLWGLHPKVLLLKKRSNLKCLITENTTKWYLYRKLFKDLLLYLWVIVRNL
jgi:hypothetical protein